MLAFIIRRLLQAIVVMLTVALIAFTLFRFVGDPINQMVGIETSAEERAALRQQLGLDDPVLIQFVRFVKNAAQLDFGNSYQFKTPVIDLIADRFPATMELALADMDADTHLHVSFDVDFLDPEIAPGVATTVPGGPTYREAQLCMEMIADTGRLASLDVMELNPARDVRNKTAALAVDLIESLFGKSTLMRQSAPT